MHFCNNCENMLYIKFKNQDANELIYYCRHCGNEEEFIDKKNICLMKTEVNEGINNDYINMINDYTKLDKTLPIIKNIKCPNVDCPSSKGSPNEVLYIRYNEENLDYVYLCTYCNTTWKSINN